VSVEIVARTGWTTAELDAGIDAAAPVGPFDLVTLQIGVNDQYRGLPVDGYRVEFAGALDRAIGFAGGDPGRVIVVSIPDWGVTPFAGSRDRSLVSSAIDAFNDANREVALAAGAEWVDVTGISRSGDPGLVAGDGLHPSADQYTRWVEAVLPVARRILSGG
jgi:lysophospholipase L1-like esterase